MKILGDCSIKDIENIIDYAKSLSHYESESIDYFWIHGTKVETIPKIRHFEAIT